MPRAQYNWRGMDLWPHLRIWRQDYVLPTVGSAQLYGWVTGAQPRLDETSAGQGTAPGDHWIPNSAEPSPLHLPSPWISDPCCVYFNKTHPTSMGEFFLAGQYGSGGKAGAPHGCGIVPRVCSGTERAQGAAGAHPFIEGESGSRKAPRAPHSSNTAALDGPPGSPQFSALAKRQLGQRQVT